MKNRIIQNSDRQISNRNTSFLCLLTFWFMNYYRCTVFCTCYHFVSAFPGHVTLSIADLSVIGTFSGYMHFHVLFQGGMLVFSKNLKRFKISAEGRNLKKQFSNFYSHFALWAVTGILPSRPLIISLACFLFT